MTELRDKADQLAAEALLRQAMPKPDCEAPRHKLSAEVWLLVELFQQLSPFHQHMVLSYLSNAVNLKAEGIGLTTPELP